MHASNLDYTEKRATENCLKKQFNKLAESSAKIVESHKQVFQFCPSAVERLASYPHVRMMSVIRI